MAVLGPENFDPAAVEAEFDLGGGGGLGLRGVLGTDDAEGLADGVGVGGGGLDAAAEFAEARQDAGWHAGGRGRGRCGGGRSGGDAAVAGAVEDEILETGPLAAAIPHDDGMIQQVAEPGGVIGLVRDFHGDEAEGGGIAADGVSKALEEGCFSFVGGGNEIAVWHDGLVLG